MSQTLTQANAQWASRPADERFTTLAELNTACAERTRAATDSEVVMHDHALNVSRFGISLDNTRGSRSLSLTNWSLGQLCTKLGVPRDLLPKLDDAVASAVLNDRLPKAIKAGEIQNYQRMLIDTRTQTLRAFHGAVYDRVYDSRVTSMMMEYLPPGWRNPVAYDKGKYGADLVPSGLYAGDRDMFAFMIDGGDWRPDQPNAGSFSVDDEQFNRGFFVWNSEVGAKSFGFMSFMFDVICGNHYVWGARDVEMFRARHAGKGATRALYAFRKYLECLNENTSTLGFAEAVRAAKAEMAVKITGASPAKRVETLDEAFKKFKTSFTKSEITLALDAMLREERGVTGTRYDWLAGFTAVARSLPNADDRSALEVQASKVLLTPVK